MDALIAKLQILVTIVVVFSTLNNIALGSDSSDSKSTESVEQTLTPEQIAANDEQERIKKVFDQLLTLDHRPTITEVKSAFGPLLYSPHLDFNSLASRHNSTLRPNQNIDDFRTIKIFNDLITAGPRIIADFEKLYPGATFIGMGRDSAFISDFLDAFYQELGQANRVYLADIGRDSFKDQEVLSDYLIQMGFNLYPTIDTPFFVPFDATNFQKNSQSSQLITALLNRCRNTRGCQIEDIINHLGFINTGAQRNMYNRNVFRGDIEVMQSVVEANNAAHNFTSIVSASIDQDLTYTREYHGSFGPLKRHNGRVVPTPGSLASPTIRQAIILEQILLVRLVATKAFQELVKSAARDVLKYEFPIKRPVGASQIASIRGFITLPGITDDFQQYLIEKLDPLFDNANPDEVKSIIRSLYHRIGSGNQSLVRDQINLLFVHLAKRVARRDLDPESFIEIARDLELARLIDKDLKPIERPDLVTHLQKMLTPKEAQTIVDRIESLHPVVEPNKENFYYVFTRLNKNPDDSQSANDYVADLIKSNAVANGTLDSSNLIHYVRQIRPTLSAQAQMDFNHRFLEQIKALDVSSRVLVLKQTYQGGSPIHLLQTIKSILMSYESSLSNQQKSEIAKTIFTSLQEYRFDKNSPEAFENLMIEALNFLELGFIEPEHLTKWLIGDHSPHRDTVPLGLFQSSQKIKNHYASLKKAPNDLEPWFHRDPGHEHIFTFAMLKNLITPENQNELAEIILLGQKRITSSSGTSGLEMILESLINGIVSQFKEPTSLLVLEGFTQRLLIKYAEFNRAAGDNVYIYKEQILPIRLIAVLQNLIAKEENLTLRQTYIGFYGRLGQYFPENSVLHKNYFKSFIDAWARNIELWPLWRDTFLPEIHKIVHNSPSTKIQVLTDLVANMNEYSGWNNWNLGLEAIVNLFNSTPELISYFKINEGKFESAIQPTINLILMTATKKTEEPQQPLADLFLELRTYYKNSKELAREHQLLFFNYYLNRISAELKEPLDFLTFVESVENNTKLSYHENTLIYQMILRANRYSLRNSMIQPATEKRFQEIYLNSGSFREAWSSDGFSSPRVPNVCSVALANLGRLIGKKAGK